MDVEEQPQKGGYEKVAFHEEDGDDFQDELSPSAAAVGEEFVDEEQRTGIIRNINDNDELSSAPTTTTTAQEEDGSPGFLHKNLLTDNGISICQYPLVEGSFTVKLIKFIVFTFGMIALIHVIVAKFFNDRDRSLRLSHIWVFEGNLIVSDCVVFFLVGRMWRYQGVDHLAWLLPVILCNVYFESQNYVPWLQNSVTLYAMHCVWPWQLWMFVLVLVPTIGTVVVLHVVRAYQKNILLLKLVELFFCYCFFLAPLVGSNYFHLHHWFAGWLIGMHCNFDVWWSRATMAYCWGMYINGIAVYGRDPVLTCEYAYFLSIDNHCPYTKCYLEGLKELANKTTETNTTVQEMVPVDWRNCSATGYHP